MPDIDDLFEEFLESASRHHIPENILQERANEAKALCNELELVPIIGKELANELYDVWENGV